MSLKAKAITTFLFVLALAVTLCTATFRVAHDTNASVAQLTGVDMQALKYVTRLSAALGDYDRLQYEYYATADRSRVSGPLTSVELAIEVGLAEERALLGAPQHAALADAIRRVLEAGPSMASVMQTSPIDWDEARARLAAITEHGKQARALLDRVFLDVEEAMELRQAQVARQLLEMTAFVIVFVVLAIIAALSMALSTREVLAAQAERQRLALFPERNPAAVFSIAVDGATRYINPSAHRLAERIDSRLATVLPSEMTVRIGKLISSRSLSDSFEYEIGGHVLSATLQLLPDLDECHVYVEDITGRRAAESKLEYLAWHDTITGLPGQNAFQRDLAAWLAGNIQAFAILLVGFERFEEVARGLGLDIVDELLNHIADRIKRFLPQTGAGSPAPGVYRFSGASFALLLPIAASRAPHDEVRTFAAALIAELELPIRVRRRELSLRPSVGASLCPDDGTTVEHLLRSAGIALRSQPPESARSVVFSTPAMVDADRAWSEMESALHVGIERREFLLHYQPKLDARSGKITGLEALMRWQTGTHGMIAPGEFIPVAEKSGLIIPLGRFALVEACQQAHTWGESGFADFSVAVNVSQLQFQRERFVDEVIDILLQHQLAPGALELEITESLLMQDLHHNLRKLHRLREYGVRLALDDFGTGYSSLEYLWRFPVTSIKIDRAFIQNIAVGVRERAIVRAIIDLAHGLDLTTVAEGVETAEQAGILGELQCDEFQGYFHCRPLAAPAVTEWWRAHVQRAAA